MFRVLFYVIFVSSCCSKPFFAGTYQEKDSYSKFLFNASGSFEYDSGNSEALQLSNGSWVRKGNKLFIQSTPTLTAENGFVVEEIRKEFKNISVVNFTRYSDTLVNLPVTINGKFLKRTDKSGNINFDGRIDNLSVVFDDIYQFYYIVRNPGANVFRISLNHSRLNVKFFHNYVFRLKTKRIKDHQGRSFLLKQK